VECVIQNTVLYLLQVAVSILQPIETHVDCFRAFLLDSVIGESRGSGVDLNGCGWLQMAHFGESGADGDCFPGVDVGGANFGFDGRSHYCCS
jgi:hypothetical protein